MAEPKFLKEVDRQLASTPVADWKTYLKWQLLASAAPSLSEDFVQESFAFDVAYLQGAKERKPLWKLCAESTDRLLGEALGQKYVAKYFPPEAKARMQEMVKNLRLAMGETIEGLQWMSPETKKKALEKLSTFNPKVGYPDKWKDYSRVSIRRDAFWEDVAASRRFASEDDLEQIGKPVDRGRWGMTPPTSDAYYNPLLNEIVFPAGILQPPAFSMEANDAVNYGAIGVVIGHEISHGFDDQGAQYDAQGRLENWWTAEDLKKFQEKTACVAEQFDGYFVEPGIHHNGRLVLGREHRGPRRREDRLPRVSDRATRQAAPAHDRRVHPRPAVLHQLGASSAAMPCVPSSPGRWFRATRIPSANTASSGRCRTCPSSRRPSAASRTRRWSAPPTSGARSGKE